MTNWRNRRVAAGLLAAAGFAALTLPALGQQTPESLLPPGFGDPTPAPSASPTPGAAATPTDLLPSLDLAPADENAIDNESMNLENEADVANEASPYDLPEEARRDPAFVGALSQDDGGLGIDAWGAARGRFLSILMRELDAPIASRWASILLRRALLTQTSAPRGVAGADWAAERAWLLLRMGEADPARLLVAGIDVDQFTPKLFEVAMQSALATADPAALCPLAEPAGAVSKEVSWDLARAMCAAMQAEPGTAGAVVDAVRRSRAARGIDLLLAEKVIGAGVNGRRAINIQWDGIGQLTAWRFGMANATGVVIPDALFATVGPHVWAWQARAPMMDAGARLGPASWAATLGVFSSAAYADLYGAVLDAGDTTSPASTTAENLRRAFAGDDEDARMDALRSLWDEPKDARERFARLILTARAAARITPAGALDDDAANLIASMLTAGYDISASRWGSVAAAKGGDAWALLAVGAPDAAVPVDATRVRSYADSLDGDHAAKGRLLLAALAGLGRLPTADVEALAADYRVAVGREDNWTRAIDAAARANQPATVALLAATGMQTRDWRAVPPAFLYHIVAALRQVGREPEARMIAAEAISRT